MRFWIFSDLHLDVNESFPFALPDPRPAHDAVLVAGDIVEGLDTGVRWVAATGLNERPVIYVPGNHEFYGRDRRTALQQGREAAAAHKNIHVLDRDAIDLGDVTVLGTTLWTSYDLYGRRADSMAMAERLMSDHRMIADGSRAFSAEAARLEHQVSAAWLDQQLAEQRARARATVVVTHHAPSKKSISPRFQGHPLTASFTSDLDHLFPGVSLWVHGHTHRVLDYTVDATRVINNPRGYVRNEITGFDPGLVIDFG